MIENSAHARKGKAITNFDKRYCFIWQAILSHNKN
jgi:hypothetical protein